MFLFLAVLARFTLDIRTTSGCFQVVGVLSTRIQLMATLDLVVDSFELALSIPLGCQKRKLIHDSHCRCRH